MPDRSHLPPHFPLPANLPPGAAVHLQPQVLPGTEVAVLLPNGYALSLVQGRGHATLHTAEAWVAAHDGTPDTLHDVPDSAPGGPHVHGWSDRNWITAALDVLAALPALHRK